MKTRLLLLLFLVSACLLLSDVWAIVMFPKEQPRDERSDCKENPLVIDYLTSGHG